MARNETIRSLAHKGCRFARKLVPAKMAEPMFNRIWLPMLLLCAGMTAAANAQSYYVVDCSGVLPDTYPTITSALQVAGPNSYVIVSGPCTENVVISNASNLNLGAYYGSTVNITGSISVVASNSIFLYGLNVTNALGDAYSISSSHNVTLWTSTGNGNLGSGLSASNLSDVTVEGPASFDNNQDDGIYVNSGAIVAISDWGGATDISKNRGPGVWLSEGSMFTSLGLMTIEDNTPQPSTIPNPGFGIRSLGASKVQIGPCFGDNQISGNQDGGLDIEENSELSLWTCSTAYQNNITSNGPVGISAGLGSQVTLFSDLKISGHTGSGVELYGKSQLNVVGQNLITGNGSASDPRSAGIVVDGNSEAYLRGGEITLNQGPGILVLVNSSADFTGATFTGNSRGIIDCDSSAYMVSDLARPDGRLPAGVVCRVPHNLGNRHSVQISPHIPDVSTQKKKAAQYKAMASPKA